MTAALKLPPRRSNVVLKRRQMLKLRLPQRRSHVVAKKRRILKNVSALMRRNVNRSRQKKNKSNSVKNMSNKG